MSRIGKAPISVPKNVKVALDGNTVLVEGPKGKLEREVRPEITVVYSDGIVKLTRNSNEKKTRAYHGLERALMANMVKGVAEGFSKELELLGVGYGADVKGKVLVLDLGYSHEIQYPIPEGIEINVQKEGRQIFVKVAGIDKQKVGQVATEIRSFREPEPYKGKGVRYRDEVVRRKAGKAGKK